MEVATMAVGMEAATKEVVTMVDGMEVATTVVGLQVATTEVATMVVGTEVATTVVCLQVATTEVATTVDGMEVATMAVGMEAATTEVATMVDGMEAATTVAGMVAVRAVAAGVAARAKTLPPANGALTTILAGDMELPVRRVACAHGQAVARPNCMRLEITATIMGHQTFWDKLCALQHELSEVERKINRHTSLQKARRAGCTRNRHGWVILHQGRPTSVAKRFRRMLPPELASAGNSPARPAAVSGFMDERDAEICVQSEVSPKRRPAPARAKPQPREPQLLPAAIAPTFCLNSDVQEGRDSDIFRETVAKPATRRKLPVTLRGRLRASIEPRPRTTSSDVFVSDVGPVDPPSDLPPLSLDGGDRGKSFKEEDAADDLRGIVSLDVNVDTPASVTLEIPSKAESSPIDKEEDMLRELQQLAASVQPATESSSNSDIEGTGTPDARLVITQDPHGHGSSVQAPAPAKPHVPTDPQDLLQASSGRRESEDLLDILEQLSDDSLEVAEDDAEEEEEEEGEEGEEGEEEEEESEAASATR
ncbi:Hibadh [Symbiodinium sp. CCMP2592]|nr:Hibadh [Symbiodinium sp. CCMP2592]